MPLLDVSEAFDVLFLDDITVVRRVETMVNGRAVTTETLMPAQAVVTPASPDALERLPAAERMLKAISIATMFILRGASKEADGTVYKPDEIIWHGSRYIIRVLGDYSGYGRGFVNSVGIAKDMVPPAPPGS